MRELDDAALERRLRGVLKEHLEALPLDLTVDDLDRRREAKGRCPTIRPGPRHHPACGGSPAARRWGVGGGLRPSAAAVASSRLCLSHRWSAVATASPDATSPSPSDLGGTDPQVRSLSRVREASGSPPGRWARPAPATPRCGSSMAGCSLWAAQMVRPT